MDTNLNLPVWFGSKRIVSNLEFKSFFGHFLQRRIQINFLVVNLFSREVALKMVLDI